MDPSLAPDIRPLRHEDLRDAIALSSSAGWNQQLEDWQTLLLIAPAGGFCAAAGGRVVGTAIGIDYGSFGWIAMMLVDERHRGRGIGGRLLQAALEAIPVGRPVRLDATPMGRPLYRRFGFEDETALTRHVGEPAALERVQLDAADADSPVRPMRPADLDRVLAGDRHAFGAPREALLRWSADRWPQYAWIAGDRRGRQHYAFGRRGRLFDQIGPVVSNDLTIAAALVNAALGTAGDRPVAIDAFDAAEAFGRWLMARGFAAQRPLYRMIRRTGPIARPRVVDDGVRELAIFGPEFG